MAAVARLLRLNKPGRLSLAGAYALGYGALGLAQRDDDGPDWFHELDPVDTLFLGTVFGEEFPDEYEFGNARTAWLRLMRTTAHWRGIERFVAEVVQASEDHQMPVDEGELMLLVAGRLEAAGLDQRKLPASVLPGTALAGARFLRGADRMLTLPTPPVEAAARVARLWSGTEVDLAHDGTPADALREGLAGAENPIRPGQAACSYSWRSPPRRSRRRMLRCAIVLGSVIGAGSGCRGRALLMPRCGR